VFPDSAYAEATGTFKRPVLPPGVDPNASPTKTVSISCTWLPYIRGALQQLLLQSTWDAADEADLILTQDRAMTLISMLTECSSVELPFACPFDFSTGQDGWDLMSNLCPPWGRVGGAYDAINHWWTFSDDALGGGCLISCDIGFNFASPARLTHVDVTYDMQTGPVSVDGPATGIILRDNCTGTTLASALTPVSSQPNGSNLVYSWDGDVSSVGQVRFVGVASWTTCGVENGVVHVKAANIRGIGAHSC